MVVCAMVMVSFTGSASSYADVRFAPEDDPRGKVERMDQAPTPSMDDLAAAANQYRARDGIALEGSTGLHTYRVLNLDVDAEGIAADLQNGTCPGPMRYNDVTDRIQYVAELGECGGWERFGWLRKGDVVRFHGYVTGDYIVNDVLALGVPGNTVNGYSIPPDVVLMVNNSDARNQMYTFSLVDYTNQ